MKTFAFALVAALLAPSLGCAVGHADARVEEGVTDGALAGRVALGRVAFRPMSSVTFASIVPAQPRWAARLELAAPSGCVLVTHAAVAVDPMSPDHEPSQDGLVPLQFLGQRIENGWIRARYAIGAGAVPASLVEEVRLTLSPVVPGVACPVLAFALP